MSTTVRIRPRRPLPSPDNVLGAHKIAFEPRNAKTWDGLSIDNRIDVHVEDDGVLALEMSSSAAIEHADRCLTICQWITEACDGVDLDAPTGLSPSEAAQRAEALFTTFNASLDGLVRATEGAPLETVAAAAIVVAREIERRGSHLFDICTAWRKTHPGLDDALRARGVNPEVLFTDALAQLEAANRARAAAERELTIAAVKERDARVTGAVFDAVTAADWSSKWQAADGEALIVLERLSKELAKPEANPETRALLGRTMVAAIPGARGNAINQLLEAIARLRWVEALDELDESRLAPKANREIVAEVFEYLRRTRR